MESGFGAMFPPRRPGRYYDEFVVVVDSIGDRQLLALDERCIRLALRPPKQLPRGERNCCTTPFFLPMVKQRLV